MTIYRNWLIFIKIIFFFFLNAFFKYLYFLFDCVKIFILCTPYFKLPLINVYVIKLRDLV